MNGEHDIVNYLLVERNRIVYTGTVKPEGNYVEVDLNGKHVYPCLIDGHTHMLLTIATMAMGFNACEITANGVEPHDIRGIEQRVREYASKQKSNAVIAINNYIKSAIDERRMPTKDELDDWTDGRATVIYNIDGHSTSLSSKMLELIGIDPKDHNGVLSGEENERAQGRIIDILGGMITPSMLAKGVANFHNYCAEYGIGMVAALEGNGDSEKDSTTGLIVRLAQHFDLDVRVYLQYCDYNRVKRFEKFLKNKRVGGCGDWELDGSIGSHTASMEVPFIDDGNTEECYFTQDEIDKTVKQFVENDYQVAAHAIGTKAIKRLLIALNKTGSDRLHRVEHCEFIDDEGLELLKQGNYAVMMQPGYAWIDKRYLHTYEAHLPKSILDIVKLKSIGEIALLCGSSDSPVQDMDPYLQMRGMVDFYNPNESISIYEAMRAYTINPAKAMMEEKDRGTLEVGKLANFFTTSHDIFNLKPEELSLVRSEGTYYGGKLYRKQSGTISGMLKMILRNRKKLI